MNKNDPNDARSVAVAVLGSTACPPVRADDHAAVLKVQAKRHQDLSRPRNQVVCLGGKEFFYAAELIPDQVAPSFSAAR